MESCSTPGSSLTQEIRRPVMMTTSYTMTTATVCASYTIGRNKVVKRVRSLLMARDLKHSTPLYAISHDRCHFKGRKNGSGAVSRRVVSFIVNSRRVTTAEILAPATCGFCRKTRVDELGAAPLQLLGSASRQSQRTIKSAVDSCGGGCC